MNIVFIKVTVKSCAFSSVALGLTLEKAYHQVKLELFCSNSFKVQFLSVTGCSYLM